MWLSWLNMNRFSHLLFIFFMSTLLNEGLAQDSGTKLKWSKLAPIPDEIGFAGSFAGVANGTLLVAGGANFPDGGTPWSGSAKVWHDTIFALESVEGKWKKAGTLPYPLGYGASVCWNDALIIIGGSNENGHRSEVLVLKYQNGKIETSRLPDLPHPLANTTAALVGGMIYVAGGIEKPDDKMAGHNFWALDLTAEGAGWKILESWPGVPRMLSVAGAQQGSFYVFSGVELMDGNRKYLKDAYQYTPGTGWKQIASLPHAVAAAPAPAYTVGEDQLLIFGGDDGKLAADAASLKEKHPGFSTQILNYHTATNNWEVAGEIYTAKKDNAVTHPNNSTWAPVTTTLTVWNGNIVIPGGEVRPATRTPNVLMATFEK
jgi:N-acetylneuraminate epimerase